MIVVAGYRSMQTGAPGLPGLTLRVFLPTGNPFTGPEQLRFSRYDEYADKENHITPQKAAKNTRLKKGFLLWKVHPILGTPSGETLQCPARAISGQEGR